MHYYCNFYCADFLPSQVVKGVTTILSAFCRTSDDLVYPVGSVSNPERPHFWRKKNSSSSADYHDFTSESLTTTRDYFKGSVKCFNECRNVGDDAIEKTGNLALRDLSREEMRVFDSTDSMDSEQSAEMKFVIDLLRAK